MFTVAACGGGHPAGGDDGGPGSERDASVGDDAGGTHDPDDPATRTRDQLCTRWLADHVVTDQAPFTNPSGADCDQGTLSAGGKADALKRLNGFRWLVGLAPTTESDSLDATDQACANLEVWWDFSSPDSPHAPPPSSKCFTSEGASGAGMSDIAWGNGPAGSIDQFMEDRGNATTMGHRRTLLNPPLGPVGIGYWEGGGEFGSAECVAVFGSSGGGPTPDFVAVPNPGFVPMPVPTWTWTFHSALGGTSSATVAIVRESDGANLPVTMMPLQQGFGQDAISWVPDGWAPEADDTYTVTVSGLGGGDVHYDVKPVTCN